MFGFPNRTGGLRLTRRLVVPFVAVAFSAEIAAFTTSCTVNSDGQRASSVSASAGSTNAPTGGSTAMGGTALPGSMGAVQPLRRLTREEYNNTVRDLLHDTTRPGDAFPGETIGGSGYAGPGAFSGVDARSYLNASEALAANAVLGLSALAPCAATTPENTCFDAFLTAFGARAFRRPLTLDERAELTGLYMGFRQDPAATYADAIQVVLSAILQSPQFLYHWELGSSPAGPPDAAQLVTLTDYEMASRLSYFLWSTLPDDWLLSRAAARALNTAKDVSAEAQRMLLDPRARDTVRDFHRQWLELDRLSQSLKDPTKYPNFSEALIVSMREETMAFVENVFFEGDGRLSTLMTAPFSFVNESLAKTYAVAGVTGGALRRMDLKPTERAGLFTQASVLSGHANAYEGSPILRGRFIREHFVDCAPLPAPPNVVPLLPTPASGTSLRQQLEMHSSTEPCKGCHSQMDPIGFGFDNYDAIGGIIPPGTGPAINTTGFVDGLDGTRAVFNNAVELATLLSNSDQVRRCVAKQWFRYALARAEVPEDAASLESSFASFSSAGFNVNQLLLSIVQTPAFRLRKLAAGEKTQ